MPSQKTTSQPSNYASQVNSDAWRPCIITYFDLVGIRNEASTGRASSIMLQLHRFAVNQINASLPNHSHGYVWNDSILLLSYMTEPASQRRAIVNELSEFKHALDTNCGYKTYAISVMGLTFPQDDFASPVFQGSITAQPRAVVLKTSSWAMANCFHIEEKLKKHSADWYIDSRITHDIALPAPFIFEELALLPTQESRAINMYKGYFHVLG